MRSIVRFSSILIAGVVFLGGCADFGKLSETRAEIAQTPVTYKIMAGTIKLF